MSLAGAFGSAMVRASIERQLVPGSIVLVDVRFPEGKKPKLLILAARGEEDDHFLIINSRINEFIKDRPHLLKCQVKIDKASHSFLEYDSTVACHDTQRFSHAEIVDELVKGFPDCLIGAISSEVRNQIVSAVKAAVTIDEVTKGAIIDSLT